MFRNRDVGCRCGFYSMTCVFARFFQCGVRKMHTAIESTGPHLRCCDQMACMYVCNVPEMNVALGRGMEWYGIDGRCTL